MWVCLFLNSKTVWVCLSGLPKLLMMLSNRFSDNCSYNIIAIQSLHPFCSLFFWCFLSNMIHGHQPSPSPLIWFGPFGVLSLLHNTLAGLFKFFLNLTWNKNQKCISKICLLPRCNTTKSTFSLCLSMFSFIIFKIKILLDVIILVNQTAGQIGLH